MKKLNLDNLIIDSIVPITESKAQPLLQIDKHEMDEVLAEWFYRLPKGYAEEPYSDADLQVLEQCIYEFRNGGFKPVINEARPVAKSKVAPASKVTVSKKKIHPIFNAEYLTLLYPKHSKAIMDAYRKFGSKSSNLNLFGTITSLQKLLRVISANTQDPLFKELYKISSVSGAEGGEAETSGRGGLGKGEVLCVLLTKGGRSGGTAGTDLDSESGNVTAEIKGGAAKNFKVPLAASRITPFQSQKELRRFFSLIEDVKDMDEYSTFLETIQNELGDAKMKAQDGVYFGKKPTPSDINMTEYNNLRKFFIGCYKYFYKGKTKSDNSIYVDIDSPTGEDILLQAKLKSPKSITAIKSNSQVELDVLTKDTDAIRTFKLFEYKLKNHAFVKQLNGLDITAMADLDTILKNKYIVFHEPSKGVLPAPILIDSTESTYDPKILGYTLNQVIIGFKPQ
jgi:hypothetical protein